MMHDAKIEKPPVNEKGVSDPVVVFTTNNMVLIAWWNEKDGAWWNIESDNFGIRREWFGNVYKWEEIPEWPHDFEYDEEVYC